MIDVNIGNNFLQTSNYSGFGQGLSDSSCVNLLSKSRSFLIKLAYKNSGDVDKENELSRIYIIFNALADHQAVSEVKRALELNKMYTLVYNRESIHFKKITENNKERILVLFNLKLGTGATCTARAAVDIDSHELLVRKTGPHKKKFFSICKSHDRDEVYARTMELLERGYSFQKSLNIHNEFVHVFSSSKIASKKYKYEKIECFEEFCEDGDLVQYLKHHVLTPEEIVQFAEEMLVGLIKLEKRGISHCDFKPANILRKNKKFKIGDFEYAFNIEEEDRLDRIDRGTPPYKEPYHVRYLLKLDPRVPEMGAKNDLWGLGLILFELLHQNSQKKHLYNFICPKKELDTPKMVIDLLKVVEQKHVNCQIRKLEPSNPLECKIKELLKHLLVLDPDLRLSPQGIYEKFCEIFDKQPSNSVKL